MIIWQSELMNLPITYYEKQIHIIFIESHNENENLGNYQLFRIYYC